MALVAGWQAVLWRWSGQGEIAVGTPVANRGRVELEDLIGFFVNTLVLRTAVGGEVGFGELLIRVREVALEAYGHQDAPFERVVETVSPERDLARSPLFQTTVTLQNAPLGELRLPGLSLSGLDLPQRTAQFELSLGVEEQGGEIVGSLVYSTDLYGASTAGRLVEHLLRVLEQGSAAPTRRLVDLGWLDEAERRQVLSAWNRTERRWGGSGCLHELFAERAGERPDAVALLSSAAGSRHFVSYRDLDRRSDLLGWRLRRSGVGVESFVGVCLERGLEMVTALLAVLKAGGAYLPLDPGYPQERLRFLVEDAGAVLVVTGAELRGRLPSGVQTICLDGEGGALAGGPAPALAGDALPGNAAYVLYTSGSSGRPKGVVVAHASVANYVRWSAEAYGVSGHSGSSLHTPLSFDLTVSSLWTPLLAGRPVALVPEPWDLGGLARDVAETGFGFVKLTPSHLEVLAAAPEALSGVDRLTLVVGGEALSGRAIAGWLARDGVRVFNEYGPTEATVGCCVHEALPGASEGMVPIGRPIANVRAYVLGGELEALPEGAPGELWIGGAGLARGYLGRPELTAERFVPDPYGDPGERLYRTGDRARWSAGELQYLGRVDEQVKIRGYRIEPGEVAAALMECPGVERAAVVVREDRPGQKRLVGYVVGSGAFPGPAAEAAELRTALARLLPEPLVPSSIVRLESLPLTAHGKLDRRALPVPESLDASATVAHRSPRTATEEILAALWGDVLGREKLGIDDDFFALGGHSLLAAQVVVRVRRLFGIELELRQIFLAPTLAALARRIDDLRSDGGVGVPLPPIARRAFGVAAPLSYAQQRLWFLARLSPANAAYHIPLALRLEGPLDVAALSRSLAEVVRRHEALRTRFVEADGAVAQLAVEPGPGLLAVADLRAGGRTEREAELGRLAREQALRPFDLSVGLLMRAALVRLAAAEHVLLVTVHHIASDGWSLGVLVRELEALYGAFLAGRKSPLPELPVQYADYALWQREWLTGGELERQLSYWRERLAAISPLDLPTDRPRPAQLGHGGAGEPVRLGRQATERLSALCRREGATLFMALVAGWQAVLWRWSGQGEIAVGTPVANRGRVELEDLIGFFVNTLVLRTAVGGEVGFGELLVRVREVALEAYGHQEAPFERVVEAVSPERDLARSPLFQTTVTLQNAPLGELRLPGLRLSGLDLPQRTAQFELSLVVEEQGGEIVGSLVYSTELYGASTTGRLVEHLVRVLEQGSTAPARRLGALDWLDEAERRQVLSAWNGTERRWDGPLCLHELFAEQTEERPDAVALLSSAAGCRHFVSYGDLDRRSDRLGWRLRRSGVGAESIVGVFLERGPEMVTALLAVLKAGGAYLPLDPGYPEERLRFLVEDAGAVLVVTRAELRDRLPSGVRTIDLDGERRALAGGPAPALAGGALPGNAAYVLYTSGSSGRPKGVVVAHASVANYVRWSAEAYGVSGHSGSSLHTPLSFDLTVSSLWTPLLAGRPVALVPEPWDLGGLARDVAETGFGFVKLTPSHLEVLAAPEALSGADRLTLVVGGEALSGRALAGWLARDGVRVFNEYGPTEATVGCCVHEALPGASEGMVPIGRPIANVRAYVLGGELEALPDRVPGELWIGGAGLARGYLGRPELTAERFVPDPYGGPGERLYRTGDRARRGAGGSSSTWAGSTSR